MDGKLTGGTGEELHNLVSSWSIASPPTNFATNSAVMASPEPRIESSVTEAKPGETQSLVASELEPG